MNKTVICVLILVLHGTKGKVLSKDEKLLDDSTNFIYNHETKKVIGLHVDLPTHKLDTKQNISNTDNVLKKCNKTKDSSENLIDTSYSSEEQDECEDNRRQDNSALILTPLIEEGKFEEARNLSKVNSNYFFGVESYTGFLTVNKTYNSNLFFWYFPVQYKNVGKTPWIIWLQGGPGASSLTGLFDEIGPLRVNSRQELVVTRYSWLRNHSLLFIDNPVGTGFSFTNHEDGFVQDMATYSSHLHTALQQFLQVFPELRNAPLYVAGESYAGKYVPALAMEIHKTRKVPHSHINLQGILMGNAYVDPEMISRVPLISYYFGLLSKEQLDVLDPVVKAFQKYINENNSVMAKQEWNNLISMFLVLTHQKHAYNYLKDEMLVGRYASLLQKPDIKRAIHVGNITFSFVNVTVNEKMAPDFLSSTKRMCEKLLEHYRVLVYCGNLDQMLPCLFTSEHYRTWNWRGSKDFLDANRYPYKFKSKLAGYHKTGGNLTEVVFKGAGHMVPLDAPASAQQLITNWTHKQPLSSIGELFTSAFVKGLIKNQTNITNETIIYM